jgi:hypothetical protein
MDGQLGKAKTGQITESSYVRVCPVGGSRVAFDVSSSAIDEMNHRVTGVHLIRIIVQDGGVVNSTVPDRLKALIPVNMPISS